MKIKNNPGDLFSIGDYDSKYSKKIKIMKILDDDKNIQIDFCLAYGNEIADSIYRIVILKNTLPSQNKQ